MRKAFILTFLATASLILSGGDRWRSMPPVIEDVPATIVGDYDGEQSANVFVFQDAFALFASDDNTSSSSIIWTYTTSSPATPRYSLNGHPPVDLSSIDADDNPNNPNSSKRIDQAMANGEDTSDSKPKTVTIRDVSLSPFPKQASYPDPVGGPGIIGSEIITLIASDGTTYSMRDFIAYTEDEGQNNLSGFITPTIHPSLDFTTTNAGWTPQIWNGGSAATMTWASGDGLCIETPAGEADDLFHGSWASPYARFDLAANSVYKIRMNVISNSTQIRTVPLWSLFVENYNGIATEGSQGANAYSMQVYNLDNEGGLNAAAMYGRSVFYCYFTPAAAQTPQWNDATNGAFTAQNDADNDMRIHFRVLDGGPNVLSQLRLGTVCLTLLSIDRYDLDAINRDTVLRDQNEFTADDGNMHSAAGATTALYNGYVDLMPKDGNWDAEVASVSPGDGSWRVPGSTELSTGEGISDDWPIPWESNKLLMFEASISAPTATDAANPPDILALRMDTPTYECFAENQMQALSLLGQQGMPTTTPSTYTLFFYTHSKTASSIASYAAFRPIVEATCHPALVQRISPTGWFRTTNTGGIRVHEMKVTEVNF